MSNTDKPKMPTVNKDIDWKTVLEYAVHGCNELEAGRTTPDFEHLVTANVLEAIYGPYVWTWIHARQREIIEKNTEEFLKRTNG
jgi:hypothetical protein